VVRTYDSRKMLDVSAAVPDIESAFHVTLYSYNHPTEPRQFYAPAEEPSVAAGLPILDVSGLDDFSLPRPMLHCETNQVSQRPLIGSGPGGYYWSRDFRSAYVPGVSLDGSGQSVAGVPRGFDAYDIEPAEP